MNKIVMIDFMQKFNCLILNKSAILWDSIENNFVEMKAIAIELLWGPLDEMKSHWWINILYRLEFFLHESHSYQVMIGGHSNPQNVLYFTNSSLYH